MAVHGGNVTDMQPRQQQQRLVLPNSLVRCSHYSSSSG